MEAAPKYSIVVPVFNAEKSIVELVERIEAVMQPHEYELVLVDDCSMDASWERLCELKSSRPHARIYRLSKNFGQPPATLCGIHQSKGEMIITIDDDLQYLPEDIPLLIEKYNEGNWYLCFGIPEQHKHGMVHKHSSGFARFFIRTFMLQDLQGRNYFSSFRIFDRQLAFSFEEQSFLKNINMFPYFVEGAFIGHTFVKHQARAYDKSNYTLGKRVEQFSPTLMIFNRFPLRWFLWFGLLFLVIDFGLLVLYFTGVLEHVKVFGELFLMLFMLVSVCMLVSLAIVSKYLAKVFLQIMGKPEYVIIDRRE